MITKDQFKTMDKGTMLVYRPDIIRDPAVLYYITHRQDDTIIVQNQFSDDEYSIHFEGFKDGWTIATPLEVILYSTKQVV